MSEVALFVGGPKDGEVTALREGEGRYGITVPCPPRPFEARRFMPYENAYVEPVRFETVHYRREVVVLFGRRLVVYVDASVRSEYERDGLVMKHVLSPLALGVLGGRA